jgi:type IV secretory pathway TraG/TraD family ATPase VirD4
VKAVRSLLHRSGLVQQTERLITLGGQRLPRVAETQHVLVCGTTGTGKSTLISEVIEAARGRGDRLVVCDPAGTFLSHFARNGDVVLNPFDRRAPGWSVFNEMRVDYDAERLARSIVPDGRGEDAAWHHYARVLLAAVMRVLIRSGESTTAALIRYCTAMPASELGALLAGTPAVALFEPDAAKALASTRFIIASHLTPHAFLRSGGFSLRQWTSQGAGSLFLTWRPDMQAALAPLMAAWIGIIANETLSLAPDPNRRLWLVLDELAALGQIPALCDALSLGRKYGLCVLAGLQSTAQLDQLYGREAAITLRACFRTLVVLGISRTDPDTAEMLSRALGDREVTKADESRGLGDQGYSRSATARRVIERLLLPSEIAGLPDLSGHLAIAGTSLIHQIALTPIERRHVVDPFQDHNS